ncbi:helix-turn-helix domain-containing protein [Gemelliphila palaticanis]|uniref:Helix-turn-helix domain-containing protein n=1 Tax=Gemelliphila palaticanis TaxID=81950 RepID=A0ABX2T070_9BACL|nr:helix-turn-helix domain-containing protein [Gemella palaticanis]MBF0714655.1 helix-turn-helix domain-containing protein [Gemella palaticanis]NYS46585.1 helix-turn-helix domain-containing protein [Gemella palaticanis]
MNLREYRFLKNLTQKELSLQIGISESCISQYENGKLQNGVAKRLIDRFIDTIKELEDTEAEYNPQNNINADIQEQELQEQYINLLLKKALNSIDLNEKKLIINKISSIVNL